MTRPSLFHYTADRDELALYNQIFETLVQIDPSDVGKLVPELATKWTIPDDAKQIVQKVILAAQARHAAAKAREMVQRKNPMSRADEIRLIDIALLLEHRNAGIGARLLQDLLAEAAQAGKPVRIHVEKFNPALRLYERLGFTPIEDQGVYLLMQWSPDAL